MRRFELCDTGASALLVTVVLFLRLTAFGAEPEWKEALAYGAAPECPAHLGTRSHRSEIAGYSHTTVLISATSSRDVTGCRVTAELQINRAGDAERISLPDPSKQDFSIVDFSPEGSLLLLALDAHDEDYSTQYRDVSVALMPLSSREVKWHNAWDLFGWKKCDAMVEPQGFLPDGRVLIRARQSILNSHRQPNCVNDVGLYTVDPSGNAAVRLPDSTTVTRFGTRQRPGFQACKSDPDIVGECFNVHGRLSAWNGTPTMRIWRIGTKRILGVHDDIMPESLTSKMNWDVEAFGDFEVCPFTVQKPEAMQMVCIESAEHVTIKQR